MKKRKFEILPKSASTGWFWSKKITIIYRYVSSKEKKKYQELDSWEQAKLHDYLQSIQKMNQRHL